MPEEGVLPLFRVQAVLPVAPSVQPQTLEVSNEQSAAVLDETLPPPAGDTEQSVSDVEPERIVVIPFLQGVQYRPSTE